jgi:hypothetical protein
MNSPKRMRSKVFVLIYTPAAIKSAAKEHVKDVLKSKSHSNWDYIMKIERCNSSSPSKIWFVIKLQEKPDIFSSAFDFEIAGKRFTPKAWCFEDRYIEFILYSILKFTDDYDYAEDFETNMDEEMLKSMTLIFSRAKNTELPLNVSETRANTTVKKELTEKQNRRITEYMLEFDSEYLKTDKSVEVLQRCLRNMVNYRYTHELPTSMQDTFSEYRRKVNTAIDEAN